jgi:hypothetical protein
MTAVLVVVLVLSSAGLLALVVFLVREWLAKRRCRAADAAKRVSAESSMFYTGPPELLDSESEGFRPTDTVFFSGEWPAAPERRRAP